MPGHIYRCALNDTDVYMGTAIYHDTRVFQLYTVYRIAPNFRGLIFSWSWLIFVIHRRFVILGVSNPVLKGAAKNFS